MPETNLPHLFANGYSETREYIAPPARVNLPTMPRNRRAHGTRLIGQLQRLRVTAAAIESRREQLDLPRRQAGFSIAIEIRPKGALNPTSVEWKRDGIEVLSFVDARDRDVLVVFVPDGKLSAFEKRVNEYLEKDTEHEKPAHMALVNAIEQFRAIAFGDLWTSRSDPPAPDELAWYQVWLRSKGQSAGAIRDEFAEEGENFGIIVEPGYVTFPGRVVVAVQATRDSLQESAELLDLVAEFRSVAPTAEFFLGELTPADQAEWGQDLVGRIEFGENAEETRVALLDTGVNRAHPLLSDVLGEQDLHAYDETWGLADHEGHGTEMAGISAYGNLTELLASNEPVLINHVLESAKILPPNGANSPHLYGAIVARSAELLEGAAETDRRVFAMMTTAIGDTSGDPSEWSATIDQLAFGRPSVEINVDDDENPEPIRQRLFVLAAGNVQSNEWHEYPNSNAIRSIEDPAQAWNAIGVGAYTTLADINAHQYPGYQAIADVGALAPSSRTSLTWINQWPFKPDVVAEGGNGSIDGTNTGTPGPDSVRMVTTASRFQRSLFCETGDTSAATAEVARLCAQIWSRYPDYWPETVRALVIHGARHTPAMRANLSVQPTQRDKRNLLRTVGYGAIQPTYSLSSSGQRATIVLEETLTPFRKDGSIKMGNHNIHELPWPSDELLELEGQQAELRITLSYFVDPNPSKRGWNSKYRYPSFGLRFSLKGASETDEEFLSRVNLAERDADDEQRHPDPDVDGWTLGSQLRTRGSIHSDVWTGTAAALAAKGQIAVYPVGGWWKDWKDAEQWDNEVRYSLVVSLELPVDVETDIYQPIAHELGVPIDVEIDTSDDDF
ncbi:S8 family peptidase [Burkholderia cenocepacia]|uniref:S8 family peptidase n=1 Tax=Burkholderia cenocepacia TaxID=95486 RepID=UPI002B240F2D|nr:S8 family peptidase [Burkholderia cenocepacia]MEB2609186.1 S8 family peptidase [Burkholderia cenocepacia]